MPSFLGKVVSAVAGINQITIDGTDYTVVNDSGSTVSEIRDELLTEISNDFPNSGALFDALFYFAGASTAGLGGSNVGDLKLRAAATLQIVLWKIADIWEALTPHNEPATTYLFKKHAKDPGNRYYWRHFWFEEPEVVETNIAASGLPQYRYLVPGFVQFPGFQSDHKKSLPNVALDGMQLIRALNSQASWPTNVHYVHAAEASVEAPSSNVRRKQIDITIECDEPQ